LTSSADNAEGVQELQESANEVYGSILDAMNFLKTVFEDILPKSKILLTVAQIISNLPNILLIT
jgi:hypothetical protein